MNHKYIVTLTDEERNMLQDLIAKGRTQGYRIKHAQILLKLDEIPENREWTLQLIADELVRLGVVESISDTAVMDTLKKTNLSLGKRRNGASPSRERNL